MDAETPQLLVLSLASDPNLPRRLPGGTLFDGEDPVVGLFRELSEETGLEDLQVMRKLGVRCYYKRYTQTDVERHDYLLRAPGGLPASFSHTVSGNGGDAGAVFDYRWIGPQDVNTVDPEFRRELAPDYLPELFAGAHDVTSESEGG
jgi:ADP-ribose pyrophosphatase YjhB (NUDIX family)